MNKLKWGCIQPLTGGMYIGARNAIGHDAEWIISYPGLTDTKIDKEGVIVDAGNEYNLIQWFTKNNINVPYYTFGHKMFDNPPLENVTLNTDKSPLWDDMFKDIDIVVAVPVCAGLSSATIASSDTKKTRNCNMEFIAEYTLGVIKPKAYIFENAPALYGGAAGEGTRNELNGIADKYGYSITYYKTDTRLHDNCQKRPRTFVIFTKTETSPVFNYEQIKIDVPNYLKRIPENASQQDANITLAKDNEIFIGFFREYYGEYRWREYVKPWILYNIIDYNLWDKLYTYIDNYDCEQKPKDKLKHHLEHIYAKVQDGKNYYSMLPQVGTSEYVLACMFKNVPTVLHWEDDRLYNIREWLHFMGMPHDFEMYGNPDVIYPKIGQNVPARTAQWIVAETVRVLTETPEYTNEKTAFFDNTKQK